MCIGTLLSQLSRTIKCLYLVIDLIEAEIKIAFYCNSKRPSKSLLKYPLTSCQIIFIPCKTPQEC